jgi:hypothetical protein
MKKIVFALLIILFPSIAIAEIGQSASNFERTKFVRKYNFIIDTTIETGVFSTSPGKEKSLYKNTDERFWIELLTDKGGKTIFEQTLNYHLRQKPKESDADRECALDFFNEATGGKSDEKDFLSLYDSAPKHVGIKQEARIDGFLVSVVIYHQALFNEWFVVIKKTAG